MSPLSLVSVLVQERNSIPNSSRLDHSFTNQHMASRTAQQYTKCHRDVSYSWCILYVPVRPFSAACSASICFERCCRVESYIGAQMCVLHFLICYIPHFPRSNLPQVTTSVAHVISCFIQVSLTIKLTNTITYIIATCVIVV